MYRSHTCGELRESHINEVVTLSGWVQKTRDKGFVVWIDLRDRYGITQLIFDEERTSHELLERARSLGREFVIQVKGKVIERTSKNSKIYHACVKIESNVYLDTVFSFEKYQKTTSTHYVYPTELTSLPPC